MDDRELKDKLARDISCDNLCEVRRNSEEIVKKTTSKERIEKIFKEVAESLLNQFGPHVSPDSLVDAACVNYFYLIASSEEYREYFQIFDQVVSVDYESILFKSIEISDSETIRHLIIKKPELLNIRLRWTFGKQTMREFLRKQEWGADFNQFIEGVQLEDDKEPQEILENPSLDKVKEGIDEKIKKRAA